MQVAFIAFGTLADQQTVPRAELRAFLAALQHSTGDVEIFSDCLYVVKAWAAQGGTVMSPPSHRAWWEEARRLTDGRSAKLSKVKAHLDAEAVVRDEVAFKDFLGNAVADHIAGIAASRAEMPAAERDTFEAGEAMAAKIRARIVAAYRAFLSNVHELEAPRPAPVSQRAARPRREPLQRVLASSSHQLVREPRRWRCLACLRSAQPSAVRVFARSACARRAAPPPEPTPEAPFPPAVAPASASEPPALAEPAAVSGLNAEILHGPGGPGAQGGLVPERADPAEVAALGLHGSHSFARYGLATFCWRCGAYAVATPRLLRAPCKEQPSARGRANLTRIREGKALDWRQAGGP